MSTADQHKNIYKEEAYELLSDLESALLELEQSPDDMELIGRIFRALHTIKGSGSNCSILKTPSPCHALVSIIIAPIMAGTPVV